MFNFLVTSQPGRWEKAPYEWDKGRILEYTEKSISDKLERLSDKELKSMISLPCLFAYESSNRIGMKVGRITGFDRRQSTVLIKYELESSIPEISYASIEPYFEFFDIRKWEMNRTHWAVKDGDLLEKLKEYDLLPQYADVQSLPSGSQILSSEGGRTVTINSLQDFIQKILSTTTLADNEVFYRGHSSKEEYKLEPRLFRKDEGGNLLYLPNEHLLYRELLVSNSGDFAGDSSTLDRLVRMQHYSLPTRLLDITSNPLIALFFACNTKDKHNKTGEVIRFSLNRGAVNYFDSDTASCLANISRLPSKEDITYSEDTADIFSLKEKIAIFNEQPTIRRLHHFICEEKPYFERRINPEDLRRVICVKGKRTNDRISSQSGAFLLFGNNAKLNEAGDDTFNITRYSVTNKKQLLNELDAMNINDSTVFPYIENSAKYVAEKFKFVAPSSKLSQ